ncbi:UNKNOWN [Stylonychia lemnae]|uniref:Uncharacterized protein n=1 Tax=Stylonychia lemnae TaxID=5949 RepID=A0A077ZST8_STYLE|nr:UNKNOWN [Stylonychia lemnae]|eukprot:CDW72375.1 UNKNOWN [Stylonychia lemnae]
MGVLTYIFGKLIYPVLFTSGATIFAFRLGNELPIAARRAGQSIGMSYNYFKVTLKFFTPESKQANEIISQFRRTSQQAHAFTREFKHNLSKEKKNLQKYVPELGIDPLKPNEIRFILKTQGEDEENQDKVEDQDKKQQSPQKQVNGSVIMQEMMKDRRELIEFKHKKRMEEEHYLKF